MFDSFVRAYDYARQMHAGQLRLDGEEYINHPVRVALEVMRHTISADMEDRDVALVSALLHDVVEDTPATTEDVAERFGPEVARVVLALSHEDEEEPDAEYLARVAAGGDIAVLVKCCDKVDNIRSLSRAPADFRARKIEESWAALPIWREISPAAADIVEGELNAYPRP